MALVKFKTAAVPVIIEETGFIKYAPGIRLKKDGDFILMAHQGNIIYYDTAEEAEKYFENED